MPEDVFGAKNGILNKVGRVPSLMEFIPQEASCFSRIGERGTWLGRQKRNPLEQPVRLPGGAQAEPVLGGPVSTVALRAVHISDYS